MIAWAIETSGPAAGSRRGMPAVRRGRTSAASRISAPSGVSVLVRLGVDLRGEAEHERGRERPRLAAEVDGVGDAHARLLEDLADHGGLERLARLDESGEQREPVALPERVRAEQDAVVGIRDPHDDGGVGAREHLRARTRGRAAPSRPSRLTVGATRAAARTRGCACQFRMPSASVSRPASRSLSRVPTSAQVRPGPVGRATPASANARGHDRCADRLGVGGRRRRARGRRASCSAAPRRTRSRASS